jgi:DNA-binding NtrC family response regulator
MTFSIYIVDDEGSIRQGIADTLASRYAITTFSTAEDALDAMKSSRPDLVLLDIGLPGMNGVDALGHMKRISPETLVIMITAYEDVRSVVSTMKGGAHDYIVKPLQVETLEMSIRNALETVRLKKEIRDLQERYLRENVPLMIGESNEIRDVLDLVGLLSKSPDTPVLIVGETGTGKELIAGAVHFRSPNFEGPLVSVNCASIPKELIESELFGYEKGAFTGATGSKKGLVEQAAGGTLFLDEVGDLGLEAQAKMLRFLEEGEFYRVGGTRKLSVHTRIVSATNKNLPALIEQGLYREDLYYRLAVVKIEVPSLDDRRGDIVPIALHFLGTFGRKFGKTFTDISPEAKEAITARNWRGNVRELRNVIERAALVGKGPVLSLGDLCMEARPNGAANGQAKSRPYPPIPADGLDLRTAQETMERFYLEEALALAGGNESRAAALLRLNHHTFRYRARKLGL